MVSIINCECEKCSCNGEFEAIDGEQLLNLIQHGRLTPEQSTFLKSRVDSKLCKSCFIDEHTWSCVGICWLSYLVSIVEIPYSDIGILQMEYD